MESPPKSETPRVLKKYRVGFETVILIPDFIRTVIPNLLISTTFFFFKCRFPQPVINLGFHSVFLSTAVHGDQCWAVRLTSNIPKFSAILASVSRTD